MKSFAVILLSAGLVSANLASPVAGGDVGSAFDSLDSGLDLSGLDLDPSSLDLGSLDNLDIDGLDLGNIDLSNNNDVVDTILELMGSMCLGNVFSLSSLESLGSSSDLQLLLEISELAQLEQLGFLNIGDIQSLFSSGFSNDNFDLGVFKRAIDDRKKTLKRTKLRRTPGKRQAQCSQQVVVNGGSTTTVQVFATSAAEFTVAAATAEATATVESLATTSGGGASATASAAAAVASATGGSSDTPTATAAAPDPDASDNLADFTR